MSNSSVTIEWFVWTRDCMRLNYKSFSRIVKPELLLLLLERTGPPLSGSPLFIIDRSFDHSFRLSPFRAVPMSPPRTSLFPFHITPWVHGPFTRRYEQVCAPWLMSAYFFLFLFIGESPVTHASLRQLFALYNEFLSCFVSTT